MSATNPHDALAGTIECIVRGDGPERLEVRPCRASFYIEHRHVFWPTFDYDTEVVLFDRRFQGDRPIIYRTSAMRRQGGEA